MDPGQATTMNESSISGGNILFGGEQNQQLKENALQNNPDVDIAGQFQNIGQEEISFEEQQQQQLNQDGIINPLIMNESQGFKRQTRMLDDQSDSISRPKSMVGKRNFNYSQLDNGNYEDSLMYSVRGGLSPGINQLDSSMGAPTQVGILATFEPTKWVPNERFDSCQICTKLFGIFRRKHHCRACGVLVCQHCSPEKEYVQGYKDVRVRICKHCAATKLKRQTELKTQNIFISAAISPGRPQANSVVNKQRVQK